MFTIMKQHTRRKRINYSFEYKNMVKDIDEEIREVIRKAEINMARHEGRMEMILEDIDRLKREMKETDKALRRLL